MQFYRVFLICAFCGFLFSCQNKISDNNPNPFDVNEKIDSLIKNTDDTTDRQKKLVNIISKLEKLPQDTTKLKALSKLSKYYSKQNDSIRFYSLIQQRKNLAKQLKDTLGLAKTNWDLAYFYYTNTRHLDSAYFYYTQAEKNYISIKDDENTARVLINISSIQLNIKDYLGSEATSYRVLELLQDKKSNHLNFYRTYNNLGVALKELKDFEKSLTFFELAENYLNTREPDINSLALWNNIGSIFGELKKYSQAEKYFSKALDLNPDLELEDPYLYIVLLNNIGQNRMKKQDTSEIKKLLDKALGSALRNENNDGFTLSQISLAQFYLQKQDTIQALNHILEAKASAELRRDNRGLLYTLSQLVQIDKKHAGQYAQDYIRLNDSFQHRDRLTQNKFAGIRYETNVYRAQTERLSNRLFWVVGISSGILITLGMLFIIFRQRSRNKELLLTQQKHEADRQIYKLVLKQQRKYEEGREIEKKRIARELHDGILGKLFGLQLNLEMLNGKNDIESQEKRWEYIDQIREVSQEIRSLSHDLNRMNPNPSDYVSVLSDYIEKQNSDKTKFELFIDDRVSFETMDTEARVNLFRIIQEAIHNIHKHAQATQVQISLEKKDNVFELNIEDNGKGMGKKATSGIGIKNMKTRAREMDGKLHVFFQSGQGTRITLKIPY